MTADVYTLRQIWQQSFGDPDEILDAFFSTGFSESRYHCLIQDGDPVSALYWFDCMLDGQKLAYLYAVATKKSCRGKGLARRLIVETHEILKKQGYAGAILVPGTKELFGMYEKMGYRTTGTVREFSAQRGDSPAAFTQIDAREYARLRRQYLPAGGVVQEGATLDFLQTQCRLYKGEDFLLAAAKNGDMLIAQELLGNEKAAPGILRSLGAACGNFRTPGNDRPFAMFIPFTKTCPTLTYFGLALD